MPRFEFNPLKSARNEERHGLSFREAQALWERAHVIIPAKRVLGEPRWAILGRIEGRVHVAIFTKRGEALRLISCHRADKRLEMIYERYLQEEGTA